MKSADENEGASKVAIVVIGGVSIDSFRYEDQDRAPRDYASTFGKNKVKFVKVRARPGGSWLLASLIKQSHEMSDKFDVDVYCPDWKHLRELAASNTFAELSAKPTVHEITWHSDANFARRYNISHIEIEHAKRAGGHKVYQCKQISGIEERAAASEPAKVDVQRLDRALGNKHGSLLMINHIGGALPEDDLNRLLSTLSTSASVILKTRWPALLTPDTRLRNNGTRRTNHLYSPLCDLTDRLLVVIDAADIRADGISISQGISWDRTAADVVSALHNSRLKHLLAFQNVIIRFGIDGALHLQAGQEDGRFQLTSYYDPTRAEGDFERELKGRMSGYGTVFCASLCLDYKTIFKNPDAQSEGEEVDAAKRRDGLDRAIRQAIAATRRLLEKGYKISDDISINHQEVFDRKDQLNRRIAKSNVPTDPSRHELQPWSFLGEITDDVVMDLAENIVREGKILTNRFGVPQASFGVLETLDRMEIEGYRSIRNLFREYLDNHTETRPLSVAVFGQPGSGKSFGVKQVAASLRNSDDSFDHEFNIAQFSSADELAAALHVVRNDAVKGEVPLVFFDEFDATFEGRQLGWLKYFLAPMQDGSFRDGHAIHPIGRAILIFAGGTSHTFEQFRDQFARTPEREKEAKLPDFVSRLRGFVNIAGPNKRDPSDVHFVIRRAVLLRGLLTRKRKGLMENKQLNIDPGVLRAFLLADQYRHGARSIEALIEMSTLAERRSFDRSALPTSEQLNMHVDADNFWNLVLSADF